MAERRKDSKGRVLKEGESQRQQGGYQFRWRTSNGERKYVYASTLDQLREKESVIQRDKSDGIRTDVQKVTVNDIYDMWVLLKKGLKENTFQNYKYMYEQFVRPDFGTTRLSKLRKSDVRRFYNLLVDDRCLKISTVDGIHTVLHQVLDLAAEDDYLRKNPSDNALKELKKVRNLHTDKRKALTVGEQNLFMDFLKSSQMYSHWYPVFALMLGSGLRVGEATGLRWEDIDFDENTISVNHTLVYFNHAGKGCDFAINTPKTRAGNRAVPMIESVQQALVLEKEFQQMNGIKSEAVVDGYHNFVFVNRFGGVHHQGTLNKAIRRIIRDCNQEVIDKANGEEDVDLLPKFSCHTLRHTFTTRLCESGINIKVIQEALGHSDISTTLDIYADVTKDLKEKEFNDFEDFLSKKNVNNV